MTLLGDYVSSLFSDSSGPVIYFPGSRRSRDNDKDNDGSFIAVVIAVGIAVLFLALTHLMALMVNFAISRSREFMADAGSAQLTKNPEALISALNKIEGNDEIPGVADDMMAMMISADPSSLFATHPAVSERVSALQKYAGARLQPVTTAAPSPSFGRPAPAGSVGFAGSRWTTFEKRGAAA